MNFKEIEKYTKEMERLGLRRLTFTDDKGNEVTLERDGAPAYHPAPAAAPATQAAPAQEGTFIKSPMVGTFYTSPAPSDPAFVQVGDVVNEETVVCIVEAMKVMNEVKAGTSGTIKRILLDNMQAVEFGTKLFEIG
ncbi:MAG: acetyl-CoA carboxylase biotin carboxyl carrier protein [Simkaniaceae bacterium]|nr:acetyl-CoA carboxylase biotin carboxyl carrier protein [Simkaniaceae bacterium]